MQVLQWKPYHSLVTQTSSTLTLRSGIKFHRCVGIELLPALAGAARECRDALVSDPNYTTFAAEESTDGGTSSEGPPASLDIEILEGSFLDILDWTKGEVQCPTTLTFHMHTDSPPNFFVPRKERTKLATI